MADSKRNRLKSNKQIPIRKQTVRNEVIACLADGHWWTVGELADTVDTYQTSVRRAVKWLEERGFVEKFDDETPAMYGWTVEPKAVERVTERNIDKLLELMERANAAVYGYEVDRGIARVELSLPERAWSIFQDASLVREGKLELEDLLQREDTDG